MEPIQQLFQKLDQDLRKDGNGPNVKSLMEEYMRSGSQDWKNYANFNDYKYARNLVNTTDMLELMVICWKATQVSPIHNHGKYDQTDGSKFHLENQHCWAAVLQGTIEETHFQFKNTHSAVGSGPLEIVSKGIHHSGEVSYIHDDIALHVLRPINGEAGVTLHLYSKPIAQCNIYDPETGQITRRKCGFYTVNKVLQENVTCQTLPSTQ